MALDAVGGNMEKMTPISGNGYKDIQYEVKHRSDDWRLLSDLLPEGVRRFQDPVQPEMLPTKYSDPNAPTPPVKAEPGDSDQGEYFCLKNRKTVFFSFLPFMHLTFANRQF